MAKIYFKDEHGKNVSVEVSDEIAKNYRESLQEEWRGDSYESYHTTSLDSIIDAGHDFADENTDIERMFLEKEAQAERKILMIKLKTALPNLTDMQRKTIYKLFVLNMTQAEIAREENVTRAAVTLRIDSIFAKLKKILEEN